MIPLTFADPTQDAEQSVTAIARAYAGTLSKKDMAFLLDILGGADPVQSAAAGWALGTAAKADILLARTMWSDAATRPPLTRALLALAMRLDAVLMGQSAEPAFAADIAAIAQGSDVSAAAVAQLAMYTPLPGAAQFAGTKPPVSDSALPLLDDPNSLVRFGAVTTLARLPLPPSPIQGLGANTPDLRELVLRHLDDADPAIARAMGSLGSNLCLFGSGSARVDLMPLRTACSAMDVRIRQSAPMERAALVRESINVAGESGFLIPAWVQLLGDRDPAVRAAAADGLRRYSRIAHPR
jgi:hypothetical protein